MAGSILQKCSRYQVADFSLQPCLSSETCSISATRSLLSVKIMNKEV
jgi:hypothetical protein